MVCSPDSSIVKDPSMEMVVLDYAEADPVNSTYPTGLTNDNGGGGGPKRKDSGPAASSQTRVGEAQETWSKAATAVAAFTGAMEGAAAWTKETVANYLPDTETLATSGLGQRGVWSSIYHTKLSGNSPRKYHSALQEWIMP